MEPTGARGGRRIVAGAGLAVAVVICTAAADTGGVAVHAALAREQESQVGSGDSGNDCPVTVPNGKTPPGEPPNPQFHGNDMLWVAVSYLGRVIADETMVQRDGSVRVKFPWWRGVAGRLVIEGRRIDGAAPPLRASIPSGYGDIGFQATAVFFPSEGCWEIIGRVGEAELKFVVHVTKPPGSPPTTVPPTASVVTPRSRLVFSSGPDFQISLKTSAGKAVEMLRRGTYIVVVRDRSPIHNAHLTAPGFNRKTTLAFVGRQTWRVKLARIGVLRFQSDPYRRQGMRGSAKIVR